MSGGTLAESETQITDPLKRPSVVTNFLGYAPPFDVASLVEKLLLSVPPKYLVGLKDVVLTNSSGLPRKRRRSVTKSRNEKVKIVQACGLYHAAWNGERAWIEIFVDNVLKGWEKRWWLTFGFLREGLISDVLFHEIGHHIHATVQPEFREKEDVADVWKVRLDRHLFKGRYPILRALFRPLRPLMTLLERAISESRVKGGSISKAEFEERFKRVTSPEK